MKGAKSHGGSRGGHWRGGSNRGNQSNRSNNNGRKNQGYNNSGSNQLRADRDGDLEMGMDISETKPNNPYSKNRPNTGHTSRGSNNNSNHTKNVTVTIHGYSGGHIGSLIPFIESKVKMPIDILETKKNKDFYALTVRSMDMARAIAALNNILSPCGKLSIHIKGKSSNNDSVVTKEKFEVLKNFIKARCYADRNMLDLGNMDADPELMRVRLSGIGKCAPKSSYNLVIFKTVREIGFKPTILNLDNNQIKSLDILTSLGDYVPSITHVSLNCNNIVSFADLEPLSKEKKLKIQGLILTDNPFRENDIRKNKDDISYRSKVSQLFPDLQELDGQPVKAAIQFGLDEKIDDLLMELPKKTVHCFFGDETSQSGTQHFIENYFSLYDGERANLSCFYDDQALFSLNLNSELDTGNRARQQSFPGYVQHDRNLMCYKELTTRTTRLHMGKGAIINALKSFPPSAHPFQDVEKFSVDGWMLPGLIPFASSDTTPGFYINIMVHGEFRDDRIKASRSFDRNFIITTPPPGSESEQAGLPYTIVSDILTIRPYRSKPSWKDIFAPKAPEPNHPMVPNQMIPQHIPSGFPNQPLVQHAPVPTANQAIVQKSSLPTQPFGQPQVTPLTMASQPSQPAPHNNLNLPQEQYNILLGFIQKTNMKQEPALSCLNEFNWDLDVCIANVNSLRAQGSLPAEFFN